MSLEPSPTAPERDVVEVHYYAADDSIFIDHDYLIRGVAGAIVRRMVSDFVAKGRTEFSNRELRLDPTLQLPDYKDNLEARLTLLRRRLDERATCFKLDRPARGRLRFTAARPLALVEHPA